MQSSVGRWSLQSLLLSLLLLLCVMSHPVAPSSADSAAVIKEKGQHHHHSHSSGHSHPHRNSSSSPTSYSFSPQAYSKLRPVHCVRPSPCNHSESGYSDASRELIKLFNQMPSGNDGIMDVKHRVLMDWTAKADCSSAVSMFFDHMGFYFGVNYTELPHAYRPAYYRRCGVPSLCQYLDPSWLKFKMVRNPYDRAVSSYIHLMRHPSIIHLNETIAQTWSFRTYLTTFERQPLKVRYNYGLYHAGFQHRAFELEYWQQHNGTSVFDFIVHIEQPNDTLALINAHYRQQFKEMFPNKVISENELDAFRLKRLTHHFVKRSDEEEGGVKKRRFLGDTPWSNIGDEHIPKDYGTFYNEALRKKVGKLFHWDLVLYNYTFPFQMASNS